MLTPVRNTRQAEKPIFSSPIYLQSLIGFCDFCFAIVDVLQEFYFGCQTCPDFLSCLDCMKIRQHRLVSHSSDHLFSSRKPPSNLHWMNRHLFITCDRCNEQNFPGKRYQCRQCSNYNVCSNCLHRAEQNHYPSEKHKFDFIPNWTKLCSNRILLAERTIQYLRHRNAGFFEQDSLTGWTSDEARTISQQMNRLFAAAWREATELFKDEDINSPPSIIEHEKSTEILVSLEYH